MSATYSSFDTLTIGQYEGEAAHGGPMLPVLAEIPAIAARSVAAQPSPPRPVEPVVDVRPEFRPEPAHASHVAPPRFQAAPAMETPGVSPAPAAAFETPPPAPQPAPAAAASSPDDWEDSSWAAQLLALEAALRPHARLILLAALIAITGLMLVVLRAPVEALPETIPSNMVDSTHPPALTDAHGPAMVATERPTGVGGVEKLLDPIPTMPPQSPAPHQPTATITAAGPAGMPVAPRTSAIGDITPIEPHRTVAAESVASRPAPPATPPATESRVRVAELPVYPSTSYTSPLWPAASPANPPQAHLQPPTKPSSAGMQQ